MANKSEHGLSIASVAAGVITIDFDDTPTPGDHFVYRDLKHAITADLTSWTISNATEGDQFRLEITNGSGLSRDITFAGASFVGREGTDQLTYSLDDGVNATIIGSLIGSNWSVSYSISNGVLS